MKYFRSMLIALALLLPMSTVLAEVIDINTADAKEIAAVLTGVGPHKARAIVDYRNAHGRFQTVEGLIQVPGFGQATLEKNRGRITVGGPES